MHKEDLVNKILLVEIFFPKFCNIKNPCWSDGAAIGCCLTCDVRYVCTLEMFPEPLFQLSDIPDVLVYCISVYISPIVPVATCKGYWRYKGALVHQTGATQSILL